MAGSWLNALENLQGQFSGLPEVEKLFEKDFLWVDETFVLASGLFKKDTTQEDSENTNENEDPGTPLGVPPVLLPTTPGVSSDRLMKFNELHLCMAKSKIEKNPRILPLSAHRRQVS